MFRERGTFESCACVMVLFHFTRISYACVYAWACACVASENRALTRL